MCDRFVAPKGRTPRMQDMCAADGTPGEHSGDGARLELSIGPAGEVVPAGQVDIGNARLLHSALANAESDPMLQVDLRWVTYLDSAAVSVLFAHAHKPMRIVARSDSAVANVLQICGLSRVAQVELVPRTDPVEP
jgi:anti-anti-sigma factor